MVTHLKLSSHTYLLDALLLVPKFIHNNKHMKGILKAQLIHQCFDIMLVPFKQAAEVGVMLSNPWGHSWYCFIPIASYIVNTSEATLLAMVGGKMSPVTMVTYRQFSDSFLHKPCTLSTTLT